MNDNGDELSKEQFEKIDKYLEKFKNLHLSTEPLDHDKAISAVNCLYGQVNSELPKIHFVDSIYEGEKLFVELGGDINLVGDLKKWTYLNNQSDDIQAIAFLGCLQEIELNLQEIGLNTTPSLTDLVTDIALNTSYGCYCDTDVIIAERPETVIPCAVSIKEDGKTYQTNYYFKYWDGTAQCMSFNIENENKFLTADDVTYEMISGENNLEIRNYLQDLFDKKSN